jgi:hypothetical protein
MAGTWSVVVAERWGDYARRAALRGARPSGWFGGVARGDRAPEELLARAAEATGGVPFDGEPLPGAMLRPRFVLVRDVDHATARRLVELARHAGLRAWTQRSEAASRTIVGVGAVLFMVGTSLETPFPGIAGVVIALFGLWSWVGAWRAAHLPLAYAPAGMVPADDPVGALVRRLAARRVELDGDLDDLRPARVGPEELARVRRELRLRLAAVDEVEGVGR